jgi:hypothetical protein
MLPIRPLHINSHSGSDHFSDAEAQSFFSVALSIEKELGLIVSHETHRGRILSSPFTTQRLLQEFSSLKLTLDLSHWVLVCERQISIDEPAMQLAIKRTWHIHARVGTPQHAQVTNPRTPTSSEHTCYFEAIWRRCIEHARETGRYVSMTPEYGPVSDLYMPAAVEDFSGAESRWIDASDDFLQKIITQEVEEMRKKFF